LQYCTQPIEQRTNRPTGGAREVDVFRVTEWLWEVQFVERSAAAKAQLFAQEIVVEHLDESPRVGDRHAGQPLRLPRCRERAPGLQRQRAGHKGVKAARSQYEAWLHIVRYAQWRTPEDVKASHPKASILKGGRVVFNIKGNDYRLIVSVQYQAGVVAIRFFGTHAEYDQIDAEAV
jgi:mRNA interferase HigB